MDPFAGTPWSAAETVCGFRSGRPNPVLMEYARGLEARCPGGNVLDIGCGAGRNTIPLAQAGYRVHGIDLSLAMLRAARERADALPDARCLFSLADMTALPVANRTVDLIVAHGIWNLVRTDDELRAGIREAARVAHASARLFVYTFSRRSLPDSASGVVGQQFIYRGTSGDEHCYLTAEELTSELARVGFAPDARVPLVEHNTPRIAAVQLTHTPVFLEAAFYKS
jgi:ubiquinone/menaquinone biosynthesis C-methylase UbiE